MLAGLEGFIKVLPLDGPYFFGKKPSAIDFALAPFVLRIKLVLSHYMDFQLPETGIEWRRFSTWWNAVKSQSAFVNTMPQPESYTERLLAFYLPYSEGGGQDDVTRVPA